MISKLAVHSKDRATAIDLMINSLQNYYLSGVENNIRIKQRPGDMLILDNYRVLHGRGTYRDTKNRRYFRQGYMDRDIFQSKLKTLTI